MFNIEKYINVHPYLERDNDGRVIGHIDVNIDDDEISKEVEELRENLLNLHKILGYVFL